VKTVEVMKFVEVVLQGLDEKFVDRNGMVLVGVMVMSPSRIPKPENDKFDEYGMSEMEVHSNHFKQ
jgi:hypothetical protein